MDPLETLEERIRRVGHALGFDAVGFAEATPHARTEFLREWIARGYAGEMDYLERRLEERVDPRRVLPGAKGLIVVGLACPAEEAPGTTSGRPEGRIARYAGGDDYHDVLLDRLRSLEASLETLAQVAVRSRSYVDTGPIAERAAAERAGLGWIGKNSCLIHPELGSHLMLGVIVVDLALEPDEIVTDHCGTCRACLDICPTDAFVEAYVLDPVKAPWFIDLLNINLNNHDLAVAKERISRYTEAFKSNGVRITENLDTLPAGGNYEYIQRRG